MASSSINQGSYQPPIPIFSGEKYDYWCVKMKTFFVSQDLWHLVEAGYHEPSSKATLSRVQETQLKENRRKDARALSYIQQSVSDDIFPKILQAKKAKEAWDVLHKEFRVNHTIEVATHINTAPSLEPEVLNGTEILQILVSPQSKTPSIDGGRDDYLNIIVPLYEAAMVGDWTAAKGLVEVYPGVVRAKITEGGDTLLHIAAAARQVRFVEDLLKKMEPEDLTLQNNSNNTALCYAALSGNKQIAELMVTKNGNLADIRGSEEMTPLYMASLLGHSDVVWYLYNTTNDENLKLDDLIAILNKCISTDLYDVALDMLQNWEVLAVMRDRNGETALDVLARKPSAFVDGSNLGIWKKIILSIPYVKIGANKSSKQIQAFELLKQIWKVVLKQKASDIPKVIGTPPQLLFVAAELGNTKFLIELIRFYPDLIWRTDGQKRTIFHIAVLYRHEDIYNLLYEIGSIKDLVTSYKDENGNTMLHLAALLPPSNRLRVVSGAALQMQRELLWFTEVETMVRASYTERKNKDDKTPRELFTENHEGLVKEGEKWLQNTASQSMLVATLIATVVFAAAFTVPGGNKGDTGTPIFLRKSAFMVFVISDAIALFASSTSILMFLSILTSRYGENDFLKSLPMKLFLGLLTLFVSIITMMVAFTATFYLVYRHGLKWVPIHITLFACVPIVLFATLQFPLLKDIIRSTFGSRYLFKPKKRMLYKKNPTHLAVTKSQ